MTNTERKITEELKEEFGGYAVFKKDWEEDYNCVITTDFVVLMETGKHIVVSNISTTAVRVSSKQEDRTIEHRTTEELACYYSKIKACRNTLWERDDERYLKLDSILETIQEAYDNHCATAPVIMW